MRTDNLNPGKILYALLFLVLIPAILWFWARWTEPLVGFPPIHSKMAGGILTVAGGSLILWGMLALMVYGKGLPMNAYPPPELVQKGPYRLLRHPIYWGFGLLMTGYFVLVGSASGLWLVTPLTILSMIALVRGYEEIDLRRRFPDAKRTTVLDLPANAAGAPGIPERLASFFWVAASWLSGNFLVDFLVGDVPPLAGGPYLFHPFVEDPLVTLPAFLLVLLTPFLLGRKDLLRQWALSSLMAVFLNVFFALAFPSLCAQYLPAGGSALLAAPVFLILIPAKAVWQQSRSWGPVFAVLAILLSIVQLANSRSAELHLAGSVLIFSVSTHYWRVWEFLKDTSEQIANSWKEWVFNKVRVINHGFYVGFGAFLGIWLAGSLAGKGYGWALLAFSVTVIVFSALWAQFIEGSEKLKRPYGYYGALVGIPFASLIVWAMGYDIWLIIGITSVLMPWVQAIGRLRCLVNGCCHGSQVDDPHIGIRYTHPRSRVCGISGLKGELLHPTPLYSILWLFFAGFVLLALWFDHAPPSFIFGLYLILTGIGRFVEEAYRGEVQTPILRGLRLYQWTAILSVVAGMGMTLVPSAMPALSPGFNWGALWAAALGGLFTTFAMGIDFPYSNTRFSRLV